MSPPLGVRDVVVVRFYVTESRAHLERLLEVLHQSGRVRGMTVFRGAAGFGSSSFVSSTAADDADHPVVLEFFDDAESVRETIDHVRKLIAPHHVLTFPAQVLLPGR